MSTMDQADSLPSMSGARIALVRALTFGDVKELQDEQMDARWMDEWMVDARKHGQEDQATGK